MQMNNNNNDIIKAHAIKTIYKDANNHLIRIIFSPKKAYRDIDKSIYFLKRVDREVKRFTESKSIKNRLEYLSILLNKIYIRRDITLRINSFQRLKRFYRFLKKFKYIGIEAKEINDFGDKVEETIELIEKLKNVYSEYGTNDISCIYQDEFVLDFYYGKSNSYIGVPWESKIKYLVFHNEDDNKGPDITKGYIQIMVGYFISINKYDEFILKMEELLLLKI